ncbi:MAG: hypothetical protein OEY10_00260 [Nitrosopumilus sp.]|nr:hypothetical protein [Nitrosopumilus sp.]
MKTHQNNFFLDSGTYTARKTGLKVNLPDYANFIKDNNIQLYANIDDPANNPDITYQNQIELERLGIYPIPVFHAGCDFKWLDKYIETGYKYLAVGNMTRLKSQAKYKFLMSLFNHVCDTSGKPKIKIHGFGISRRKLLNDFPFYSVDSSTWSFGSRAGHVLTISGKGIFIGKGYKHDSNHYNNLSENNKKLFDDFLLDFSGTSRVELLQNHSLINYHNVKVMEYWPKNNGIFIRPIMQESLFK